MPSFHIQLEQGRSSHAESRRGAIPVLKPSILAITPPDAMIAIPWGSCFD